MISLAELINSLTLEQCDEALFKTGHIAERR